MSNRNLYDGSSGVGTHRIPFQHGPIVPFTDNQTRSRLYTQTMRVRAEGDVATRPLGSTGPRGGWLVEVSTPRHLGAGVVEWDYIYAYLPKPRTCGETTVFNYQEYRGTDLLEVPITTTASVDYEYFHTFDPTTIPQLRAFQLIKVGERIYSLGPAPASGQDLVLAEDSRVRQWRGHIYERSAIYVRRSTFTAT